LEAIVATSCQGLPFAVHVPDGLAGSANDIGLFRAKVSEVDALKFTNPIQIDPAISLVFYKAKTWATSDIQETILIKFRQLSTGVRALYQG
jgi:hypothetical protein